MQEDRLQIQFFVFMEHDGIEVLTTQNIREKCVVVLHEVIWLFWWVIGFDGQSKAAFCDRKWLQRPFFGCTLGDPVGREPLECWAPHVRTSPPTDQARGLLSNWASFERTVSFQSHHKG